MSSVRLISMSEPVGPMTVGESLVYLAKVSNPANQDSSSPRLLKYLRDHHHWSPFEMAHAVVQIITTRDIARQILRHRSFSFQEFSQRYAKVTNFHTAPARRQDTENRQNSIDDLTQDVQDWWTTAQEKLITRVQYQYDKALEMGIAKECARKILPEGLTESRLYMAGTFRSWIHYIQLRTDPSTQLEHREVAHQVAVVLADACPEIFKEYQI